MCIEFDTEACCWLWYSMYCSIWNRSKFSKEKKKKRVATICIDSFIYFFFCTYRSFQVMDLWLPNSWRKEREKKDSHLLWKSSPLNRWFDFWPLFSFDILLSLKWGFLIFLWSDGYILDLELQLDDQMIKVGKANKNYKKSKSRKEKT